MFGVLRVISGVSCMIVGASSMISVAFLLIPGACDWLMEFQK